MSVHLPGVVVPATGYMTWTGPPTAPVEQKRCGWECPRCKSCFAPHVDECKRCAPAPAPEAHTANSATDPRELEWTWTLSDDSLAWVRDNPGEFQQVGHGFTTITIAYDREHARYEIRVKEGK